MTFGLSMSGVRRVTSYAAALALYEKAVPRRGGTGSGERKLPGHSKPYTGLTRRGDNIEFIYHTTEVVTWRPDGSVLLDLRYQSYSTATFADRFTPTSLNVSGTADVLYNRNTGLYYLAGPSVTFTADEVLEGTVPITRKLVDRKLGNEALERRGYKKFEHWYLPMAAMLGGNAHRSLTKFGPYTRNSDLIDAVADESSWHDLLTCTALGFGIAPETFLTRLRKTIYGWDDAYRTETHPHAKTYNQLRSWLRGA
jgi:hypothetical protein